VAEDDGGQSTPRRRVARIDLIELTHPLGMTAVESVTRAPFATSAPDTTERPGTYRPGMGPDRRPPETTTSYGRSGTARIGPTFPCRCTASPGSPRSDRSIRPAAALPRPTAETTRVGAVLGATCGRGSSSICAAPPDPTCSRATRRSHVAVRVVA
jgi:hypothetical protein